MNRTVVVNHETGHFGTLKNQKPTIVCKQTSDVRSFKKTKCCLPYVMEMWYDSFWIAWICFKSTQMSRRLCDLFQLNGYCSREYIERLK